MKNLLLILTVIMMLVAMAPVAFAADSAPADTWEACDFETASVIDFDSNDGGGHTFIGIAPMSWTPATFRAAMEAGGTVTLNSGETATIDGSAITLANDVTLTGDGTVFITGDFRHFIVNSGVTFTLSGDVVLQGIASAHGGGVVSSGTFIMNDNATISDSTACFCYWWLVGGSGNGGGVYIAAGTFTMNDNATISGNTAPLGGGGVHIAGGTFTMQGDAQIIDNAAPGGAGVSNRGNFIMRGNALIDNNEGLAIGGVYNGDSGTFTMYGDAQISNNHAAAGEGGGVRNAGGTFNMAGNARIIGNSAGHAGGGVSNLWPGTFNMNGGTISGNSAGVYGGGVFNNADHFYISGGTIENNIAPVGNGVHNGAFGRFTMNTGVITINDRVVLDRTSIVTQSGVYLQGDGTFELTNRAGADRNFRHITINSGGGLTLGGDITLQGIAPLNGGGVLVNGGTFIMEDGATITNNRALGLGGGGIRAINGATVIINDGEISNNRVWFANHDPVDLLSGRGGGIYVNNSAVTINGGEIFGNEAETLANRQTLGGGIFATNNSIVTINAGAVIRENTAHGRGGGIAALNSTINFNGAVIEANTVNIPSAEGGGVYLNNSSLVMTGGMISENHAGRGGGIRANNSSTITINSGTISDNIANNTGAGISALHGSSVTINDNTYVTGNRAAVSAGGIHVYVGSALTMHGGVISGNDAASPAVTPTPGADRDGHGGGVLVADQNSYFTMYDGLITGNHARYHEFRTGGFGGGVAVVWGATFEMKNGEITGNTVHGVRGAGGGVGLFTDAGPPHMPTFIMEDGLIHGNSASFSGGGIGTLWSISHVNIQLEGGMIENNNANQGGGIGVRASIANRNNIQINISNTIYDNEANFGGGILVERATVLLESDGEFINNTAGTGGAAFIWNSDLTIDGGLVDGNVATGAGGGGGIAVQGTAAQPATLTIIEGTVSNNAATAGRGGGIVLQNNYASVNIIAGEISNNTATENGGGIFAWNYSNLVTSSAVIFSDNTASAMYDFSLHPNFLTQSGPLPAVVPAADSGGGQGGNVFNIEWATVSVLGTHALNNFDINYAGLAGFQTVRFNPNDGAFQGYAAGVLPVRVIVRQDGYYSQAFDANGGLVNPILSRPTLANYVFCGWFNSEAEANDLISDAGRVLYTCAVTAPAERTLWARWTEATCGNGNGGGGNRTGNATIVPPPEPPQPPQPPQPPEPPAPPYEGYEAPAPIIIVLLFMIAVAAFGYRKVEGAKEK